MKKFLIRAVSSLLLLLGLCSCASWNNSMAKTTASYFGNEYRVTLYSGQKAVRAWEIKGVIDSEPDSDGWFFNCNGVQVQIAGTTVIEAKSEPNKTDISPTICK